MMAGTGVLGTANRPSAAPERPVDDTADDEVDQRRQSVVGDQADRGAAELVASLFTAVDLRFDDVEVRVDALSARTASEDCSTSTNPPPKTPAHSQ
jgi:hypothetical protein